MSEIIKRLSEKLTIEAVQRTKGSVTKKGYDTDGYGYQYCVDRFNEVLGLNWFFDWEILNYTEGKYTSGTPYHDITVKLNIFVTSEQNIVNRSCAGGHTSRTYADALKGAITNAFKKTAAFYGVGRDAFAGTIDEDNKPSPEHFNEIRPKKENTSIPTIDKDEALKFFADFPEHVKKFTAEMVEKEKYSFCQKHNWSMPDIDVFVTKQNSKEIV